MTAPKLSHPRAGAPALVRRVRAATAWHPVWALNAAIVALAAAVYLGLASGLRPLATPHIPWWVIATAFAVAERCVVHLHFRRGAHSFSLADIPLVFGLMFCSAEGVVLGCLLGSAVSLLIGRRQPAIKLVFNLAQFALATSIAVVVMHAIAAHGVGPRTWLAAVLAMESAALVAVVLIAAAISLSEGRVSLRTLGEMVGMDLVVTMSNTSLGLCGAIIAATDLRALPLLAVPAVVVLAAYRAHLTERERHKRLEFLYEANRTLTRSPEVAQALEGVLTRSLEAFRAELAEIILFGSDENPSLRTVLGPGAYRESMAPVDAEVAEAVRALTDGAGRSAQTLDPPFGTARLQRYLEARGVTHAMIAPLPGEDRVIGAIMLANRFGVVRSFDADDRRMLETLAANATVALQYDRLEQAVHQLKSLQEQLHHQAHHDPLTGLANRILFTEQVKHAASTARTGEVAVLFIDLDDFKAVNDSLGHAAGDELLSAVASRLRGCVRPDDLVARLGGDEFAVLVRDALDARTAAVGVAQRIMTAFEAPITVAGEEVHSRLSVGIATGEGERSSVEELIGDADVAMYEAKTSGKGHFEIFHERMGAAVLRRHGLKEELRLAIERQELMLYFQPIVALQGRTVAGAEALVRWQHPRRGLVGPADFVPLAEETGLILSLGEHVLEHACRQVRSWMEVHSAQTGFSVHVNLSAVELRDPRLVERVGGTLAATGADPRSLVFEITESVLLHQSEGVTDTLSRLCALGVRIALDDFGSGYSSLSYLHRLPLSTLKVAKSFVDGMERGPRESAFVRTILELARTLGLTVIAEGIETEAQVSTLLELGCPLGQGFHLGRPRPALEGGLLELAA
jgi:diguanylate cyclase (GGDEF)-like protein